MKWNFSWITHFFLFSAYLWGEMDWAKLSLHFGRKEIRATNVLLMDCMFLDIYKRNTLKDGPIEFFA